MICSITSCPRTGANYLPGILDVLSASGFQPMITYDHGTPRRGLIENWKEAIRRCLIAMTSGDQKQVVVFQDDITVCRNLSRYVSEVEFPENCGVLSLYRPSHYENLPTGLSPAPDQQNTWGACALVLDAQIARKVLDNGNLDGRDKHLDRSIGKAIADIGLLTYYCVPSLVQHIGNVSSLAWCSSPATGRRAASDFPGEDFDSMSLIPENAF